MNQVPDGLPLIESEWTDDLLRVYQHRIKEHNKAVQARSGTVSW